MWHNTGGQRSPLDARMRGVLRPACNRVCPRPPQRRGRLGVHIFPVPPQNSHRLRQSTRPLPPGSGLGVLCRRSITCPLPTHSGQRCWAGSEPVGGEPPGGVSRFVLFIFSPPPRQGIAFCRFLVSETPETLDSWGTPHNHQAPALRFPIHRLAHPIRRAK